jgi:Zn-finger nucleic acid-binding protein
LSALPDTLIKIVHPEQAHLQLEACKVCNGVFFDAGEFTDSKFETISDLLRYYFRKSGS